MFECQELHLNNTYKYRKRWSFWENEITSSSTMGKPHLHNNLKKNQNELRNTDVFLFPLEVHLYDIQLTSF